MPLDLPPSLPPATPVTASCIAAAAKYHRVDKRVLVAILVQEGGSVGRSRRNSNGSIDYGPAQINSLWLPDLKKHSITAHHLKYDGCINVFTGAWRLSQEMAATDSLAEAVGNYHSRTPKFHTRYVRSIANIIKQDIQKNINTVLKRSNRYLVSIDQPTRYSYNYNATNATSNN